MRKFLLLAPVLLLASCRSEQLAFQATSVVSRPVIASAPLPTDSALTATVVATPLAVGRPDIIPSPPTPLLVAKPTTRQARPRLASALRPLTALAISPLAAPATKRLAHRWQRRHATAGPAESGLGGIAFFFIGVVLAVLAGLAALVNVIFGVGFFTALGYTAAGLAVLALLYVLFSGGGQKKK